MKQQFDVVVIGAGIVGAACAWEFAKNDLHVAIVEMNPIGSGATAAGMGHVLVTDDSPAQFALCHWSQKLWKMLQNELPQQAEYSGCGTLWIAANSEEMDEVERKQTFNESHGVTSKILTASQLYETEPQLCPGLSGALYVEGDLVVYPPVIAHYLIDKACQKGAILFKNKSVSELQEGKAILSDKIELQASHLVNAAGTHATHLTPDLAMKPRKGHLLITDRYPGFVNHQLIELGYVKSAANMGKDSVAFNAQPRTTGQILLGSSRQMGDESPEIRMDLIGQIIAKAETYLPKISELNILRSWTGFRAATADKLPLIGPCPWQPGVLLATGHEGLGITTSLGTARLLVDYIHNRPSEISIEPYLPKRLKEHG